MGKMIEKVGNIYGFKGSGMAGTVYESTGVSPCIDTAQGGNRMPLITEKKHEENMVLIKQATEQGYIECNIGGVADLSYPDSKTRRGRVQGKGEISPTLTASEGNICRIEKPSSAITYRIRKLTPLECWRLMDFTDEDFNAAEKVNSNTQLYKEAGNSIVVNVLVGIIGQLIKDKENTYKELAQ